MMCPTKRPLYVFCHIPKTGGSTATRALSETVGFGYVAARPVGRRVTYRSDDLRRDLRIYPWARCIGGHPLKPYVALEAPGRELRWLTLLREPVSRYISHYQHQYDRGHPRYRLPLEEWAHRFNRSNLMVRTIAGEPNVERAKEILHGFWTVGLLEQLEPFADCLRHHGLWASPPRATPIRNAAPRDGVRRRIDANWDRYEELVLEQNELDLQLYDYLLRSCPSEPMAGPVDAIKSETTPVPFKLRLTAARVYRHAVHRPAIGVSSLLEARHGSQGGRRWPT